MLRNGPRACKFCRIMLAPQVGFLTPLAHMDDRDDLLHRIQMLEQQLATVIERTGLAEPARPSPTGRSHHATEHKKARRSGGRKRSPGRQQQAPEERAPVPSRPARIPGVRIACIGARPEALDGIRSYWEGRSATFLSYDTVGTTLRTLDRDLSRADVIFFCVDRVRQALSMAIDRWGGSDWPASPN